jgi:hypothetical protein
MRRTIQNFWPSFANPTDTFFPTMKMNVNLALTSRRSYAEHAARNFSFEQYHGVNQHIIWQRINTSEFKGVTNTLKKLIKNNNFNLNFKHMISSNT